MTTRKTARAVKAWAIKKPDGTLTDITVIQTKRSRFKYGQFIQVEIREIQPKRGRKG